jgi:hypothetical protein
MLNVEALGKGTVPIDGPWQFHIGDNAAWAQPQTPDATGSNGWEQITADDTWGAQGHPAYAGLAWYRKHLRLAPAQGTDGNFALLFPQVDDAYEIYWNGQLVGRYGKLPPHPSYFFSSPMQTFGLGAARDGVLAVRVWKALLFSSDPAELGGFNAAPLVGSPEAIAAAKAQDDYAWMRGLQFRFWLWLLYGLVAVLGFLAWRRNRGQPALLALAVYCGAVVADSALTHLRLPIPANLALGLSQLLLGLQDVSLWFLLLYLFRLDRAPRVARFTRILTIVDLAAFSLDGLVTIFWNSPYVVHWAQAADGIFTVVLTLAELYIFVLIYFALRRRLDAARWFLAIAAVLDGLNQDVFAAIAQGRRYTHWTFADKMLQPLFTLNGARFSAGTLSDLLLFVAIVYTVYRSVREAAQRQSAVERELQSARELQQVLIPETLPELPGYAVTSAYLPAQEVGGDFFQIIPLEGEQTGSALVVLGDVSGKGLRAAMAVSLIVGTVRTLAETETSPARVLTRLNRRLHGRLDGGFATCAVVRVDPGGRCVAANAGHLAPLRDGVEVELPGALPLGLVPNAEYEEREFQLDPGQRLTMVSDGVVEAKNTHGELYGFERTARIATQPAEEIAHAAQSFGQEDDITALTVTRAAA